MAGRPAWRDPAQWQQQAKTLVQRSLDRHLRLAVTGLSRSGKTAFITALVHLLEQAGHDPCLPHWQVMASGRWLGARRVPQRHHHIPAFAFEAGIEALRGTPPSWPAPTRAVSELCLTLRYRPGAGLRRHLGQETGTLTLEIVDYPGEWLLDLPMLEMDYAAWSQLMARRLLQSPWNEQPPAWVELGAALQGEQRFDEQSLAPLVRSYTDWLHQCRDEYGYSLIQPGRFILPGDFAGAPMLQFVPWVWSEVPAHPVAGSLLAMLAERYDHYCRYVVKGFYRDHFSSFDRQIVLVDCLQPLAAGEAAFADLEQTLALLMRSFQYGQNNWLRRLFAPRIDRLLFAASKADHVTPDQHPALQHLLQTLVHQAAGEARFEGIRMDCLPMAALRCADSLRLDWQGKPLTVLRGTDDTGTLRQLFPGELPAGRPGPAFWQANAPAADASAASGFGFVHWQPPVGLGSGPWPHIRLDQVLEFLLGDHLQ